MGGDVTDLSDRLLRWYDCHARVMPWRVSPQERAAGRLPNPYHVWLSEVMLQQTTVAAVRAYFTHFTALWPDVHALAAASDDAVMAAWAGLGYYARARNLLTCARKVSFDYNGLFPSDPAKLLVLPGVGPYTAAAISAIAFDLPEVVVDGNVERVISRLYAVQEVFPAAKPRIHAFAKALTPQRRAGDYAQAIMDLGATICTPRAPDCPRCPWQAACRADAPLDYPRKAPKTPKPLRQGCVWVVRVAGGILFETRPQHGLLGGMLAFPGADWDGAPAAPPVNADWQDCGVVRHVFTHFALDLRVFVAEVTDFTLGEGQQIIPQDKVTPRHMPTLMRKAWMRANLSLGALPTVVRYASIIENMRS